MVVALTQLLDFGALPVLDESVSDRSGSTLFCQDHQVWQFNCRAQSFPHSWEITNELLEHLIKAHVQAVARRSSVRNAFNTAAALTRLLKSAEDYSMLSFAATIDQFSFALSRCMEQIYRNLDQKMQLHKFWRLKDFYRWGCLFAPDAGFNTKDFLRYAQMQIPGNVKGEAVRSADLNQGVLSSDEINLLIAAIREDRPKTHRELMEHVVVALGLAIGRNSENYTLILEEHVIQITSNNVTRYYLRVPRIKKRTNPYRVLKTVPIEPQLGQRLLELVAMNQTLDINTTMPFNAKAAVLVSGTRPLLQTGVGTIKSASTATWSNFLVPSQITVLMKSFVKRKNLMSGETGKLIALTPRRLRYTFASNFAAMGLSPRELASLLDHSDTQSVRVYTDLNGILSDRLEKAAAGKIEFVLALLTGQITPDELDSYLTMASTINEQQPVSSTKTRPCASCPAFQPYSHVQQGVLVSGYSEEEKVV